MKASFDRKMSTLHLAAANCSHTPADRATLLAQFACNGATAPKMRS
jgi:hypothetical protein